MPEAFPPWRLILIFIDEVGILEAERTTQLADLLPLINTSAVKIIAASSSNKLLLILPGRFFQALPELFNFLESHVRVGAHFRY